MSQLKSFLSRTCLLAFVATPGVFSFHLKSEPQSVDPRTFTAGESHYFFQALYRGLTRYTIDGMLIFDLAEKCTYRIDTLMNCKLRKNLKWSDGTPLVAQDVVDSFRRLVAPPSQCPCLPLLLDLKNAPEVMKGQAKPDQLGVKAISETEFQFEFTQGDREFLEKLSNPLLAITKPFTKGQPLTAAIVNGPYRVASQVRGQKIVLEPNPQYQGGNPKRPKMEIFFADDESTALNLYEKGVLKFLWRLPTQYIPKYKSRPDFLEVPVDRFDYLGFNQRPGQPFHDKNLRKLFAQSLNFEDFKTLFKSIGAPGCPGLGDDYIEGGQHCIRFSPAAPASQVPPALPRTLRLFFSQLGGDDIRKAAEWFQGQWIQNLKTRVELRGLEQKQILKQLSEQPPDIFRTGVGLNRPTCLAALEIFTKGHPLNYVGFENQRFENLTRALRTQKMTSSERKSVCGVASDLLFKEEFVAVPMGRFNFTMLLNQDFKGLEINRLNQIDFSKLEYVGGQK